jgi:transcriptional regulator with XRE-family HTH domain
LDGREPPGTKAGLDRPRFGTELRSILVEFRSRLRPEDVGLPASGRRRVPGLRREEVAELVGVSPNWYAAFETGSCTHRFSADFVRRVAAVLRLDDRDRVALFRLALPEVSEVAEHFDFVQASSGRALAEAIFRELLAQESLREAQAATGRTLANALYRQLVALGSLRALQDSLAEALSIAGRARATEICQDLLAKEAARARRSTA